MSNENISINGNKANLDLGSNEESKISNISIEKNKQETTENNEEEEKITNPDFDSGKEELTNLKNQLEQKNQEPSLIKTISDKTENEIKTNKKKINDLLNLNNKSDPNELPPVINYSNISDKSETVDKLKKEVFNLNKEINKMKTEKNITNYRRLENNYFKNTKEITELKQDNNLLRFQLEDLSRKLNDSNSIGRKKNNFKKKLRTFKFNKHNNLKKLYGNGLINNNSILNNQKSYNK